MCENFWPRPWLVPKWDAVFSAFCFRSGRLLSGQLARCARSSGKAVPLAKRITAAARDMADACVILQSWYFHLLVGCNRFTRGSDWAEGRLKGRLSASRASFTSTLRGQKQMSVSSKYTSACSQFSVSAQPWTGRNSVRKPEKNEMENEVPEDELVGKRDLDFRTAN